MEKQFFAPFLYKINDYTITIEIIVINTSKPQLMFDILNVL